MTRSLRIGTRGSRLALAQSGMMKSAVEGLDAELRVELVTIQTSGDRFADRPLAGIGGKGLFVKEIEEALLDGRVDLAVHSMKDVPGELAPGLVIAAVPPREDSGDLLITRDGAGLADLPQGARVGTSSLRRAAMLRAARVDLEVVPLRGNVDTRLRKLRDGEFDAIVLAAAGLRRLGLETPSAVRLDGVDFIPAVGQGALAIESRADDVAQLLRPLDDAATRAAVEAERAFMCHAGGSCVTPLAAHAEIDGQRMNLRAVIVSPDGRDAVRGSRTGPCAQAAALGRSLAEELLVAGGGEILRRLAASS